MLSLCELTVEAVQALLDQSMLPGSARDAPEPCASSGIPWGVSGLRSWGATDLMPCLVLLW